MRRAKSASRPFLLRRHRVRLRPQPLRSPSSVRSNRVAVKRRPRRGLNVSETPKREAATAGSTEARFAFYIRKSVKVGPLRVNLSKSGIGVSAGIPGFRVSSGPRGNYVHMGRGGLYYRSALGAGSSAPSPAPSPPPTSDDSQLIEIESASALQMVDESSAALLEEINAKLKATVWWPFVLGAALLGMLAVAEQGAVLLSAMAAAAAVHA